MELGGEEIISWGNLVGWEIISWGNMVGWEEIISWGNMVGWETNTGLFAVVSWTCIKFIYRTHTSFNSSSPRCRGSCRSGQEWRKGSFHLLKHFGDGKRMQHSRKICTISLRFWPFYQCSECDFKWELDHTFSKVDFFFNYAYLQHEIYYQARAKHGRHCHCSVGQETPLI